MGQGLIPRPLKERLQWLHVAIESLRPGASVEVRCAIARFCKLIWGLPPLLQAKFLLKDYIKKIHRNSLSNKKKKMEKKKILFGGSGLVIFFFITPDSLDDYITHEVFCRILRIFKGVLCFQEFIVHLLIYILFFFFFFLWQKFIGGDIVLFWLLYCFFSFCINYACLYLVVTFIYFS